MPSVGLSVGYQLYVKKNYRTDLNENFTTDVSVYNEELVEFWKSSASRSGSRNFLKILEHCKIGHFSTVWLLSLAK